MDEKATRKYSYADLLAWPEQPRYELIEGDLIMMASPSVVHQVISMRITNVIFNYLRGKTCQVFNTAIDIRLFAGKDDAPETIDTVVQPDIFIVCDRDKLDKRGCNGAPDMVAEILSPSNWQYDLWTKLRLYEKAGVSEYWIIDPETKTLAVYLSGENGFRSPILYARTAKVKVEVLDDCWIDLEEVFAE